MPGLFFTNAWMLAGLAALSVPILVHLLLKRKKKRLRFSTVQFFLKQDEQSSQRRKLRNWLLLSLRLLICTLLVLAFARPYLPNVGGPGAIQRKRVVIVLDRSLSMQANATDGPEWSRARESARQVLAELGPNDRVALVGCAAHAEILSAWAPAAIVGKVIADLTPTCAAASLTEGLQQARKLLTYGDPQAAALIYVISDLQRSSCLNIASAPIPRDVELKLVKVGDLTIPNLTVADLRLDTSEGSKPQVLVASFSDEASRGVKLELRVDGEVVETETVDLSPGASTNLEVNVPPLKPGWHDITAQLQRHDALSLDDARFQCLFTPEPARVWVAEDRPSPRSFEEESFFIRAALDPSESLTNSAGSRFLCEKVSPDVLATRLAGTQTTRPCDWVILPALRRIPAALGEALASYVNQGGGLLVFVGEGVSANRYNTELSKILPGQFGDVESSRGTSLGWTLGLYDTNSPLFASFTLPGNGNLSLARFAKRFDLRPAEGSLVVGKFDDGKPAVVLRELGRGRVVLVNSSADTGWTDWPKHKSFVPWLHGAGHFLAGLTSRQQLENQVNAVAGSDLDLDLGASSAGAEFQLHTPAGKESVLAADGRGVLRDVPLPVPGIYILRDRAGVEVRRLAVNVPVQESDLTARPADEFQQQIARVTEPKTTTLSAGLFGSASNQKELWRVLLMAALVLLFVELLVANRTLAS